MNLNQLLAMLMALQSQGATEVKFMHVDNNGHGVQRAVDWVAPKPLNGVAYVALMRNSEPASNEAMLAVEM